MVVSKELFVYAVKDIHGYVWMAAVSRPEDIIQHPHGVQNKDGFILDRFNAESYRLPVWCLEHGLQCIVTKRTIEVEFPA